MRLALLALGGVLFFIPLLFGGAHFVETVGTGQIVTRKWTNPDVKWGYRASGAPAGAESLIQQAFDIWKNDSQSSVSNTFDGTTTRTGPTANGISEIFFDIDLTSIGVPPSVVAFTFLNAISSGTLVSADAAVLTEADIFLNPAKTFITTPATAPTDLDIVEVLAHEIGHLYGVGHSFLVDAMMYPAKPNVGSPQEFLDLFRFPKRNLVRDDAAWIAELYPTTTFNTQNAVVEGRARYSGDEYIGAHVIAVNVDAPDTKLVYYPAANPQFLVVKGADHVSAFTHDRARFKIPGLLAENHAFLTQRGNSFLGGINYSTVNQFLLNRGSSLSFPDQFWQNEDCSSEARVTSSTLNSLFASAASLLLTAGRHVCNLNIEAHIGGKLVCGGGPSLNNGDCGGGGCTIDPQATHDKSFYFILSLMAVFGILIFLRASSSRL